MDGTVRPVRPHPNRRPSVDIAKSYIELNLKTVIDNEAIAKLSKRQARKKRKKEAKVEKQVERNRHRLRRTILSLLVVIVVAAGASGIWWQTSIQPVNRIDVNTRQFDVAEGASIDQVATGLQKAGFIRSALAFRIYMRLNGGIIQAGSHMLSPSFTLAAIAEKLSKAETQEVDIQIPPGVTLAQLRDTFKKYGYTDADIDAAYSAVYSSNILGDRPEGASLEGYIYPETYRIVAGDKLEVVIRKAIDEMSRVAAINDFASRFASRGLSFYQGLTLASLITKEATNPTDQQTVASVFYNRLNIGMTLGSDVTFQYAYNQGLCAVNSPDCDSVYNTRIHGGLPPGPIANPTLTALQAAAVPNSTNFLYFVAGDDGRTHFALTDAEHNLNVQTYCTVLCR
jgi:UPF0755 protein